MFCPIGDHNEIKSLRYQELAGEIVSTNTANPLMDSDNERLKIFLHALLFVIGFSVVFIIGWGGRRH